MNTLLARALLVLTLLTVPGLALAAQTPEEDSALRAATAIQEPKDAVKALDAFIAKYPSSKLVPAAHFLLTKALIASEAPTKRILDEAKMTLSLLSPAEESLLEYRIETVYRATSALIERKEQLDGARELVKIAVDGLPKDPRAGQLRRALLVIDASVLSTAGKRDEAIAELQQVVSEDADSQLALLSLAEELGKAGRTDEAIEAYVRAESVFEGEQVDGAALRALYTKKNGSLEGLDAKLAKARGESLERVALDARRVEAAAPDWQLTDLNGAPVKLSDLKGQVVVLDFWATWCPPCREELPHIQALHEKYAGKQVRIIAVNCEGAQDRAQWEKLVRSFVLSNKLTMTVVNDLDYEVNQAYGIDAFPTVLVIDKAGTIRYFNDGYTPSIGEILSAQIESLSGGSQ